MDILDIFVTASPGPCSCSHHVAVPPSADKLLMFKLRIVVKM